MDYYKETNTVVETQTASTSPRIIEYAGLMNIVQLSIARQLDMPGAHDAEQFTEVLAQQSSDERERTICEVGQHYDEALVSFITGSLIARRQRDIIILAEASEGIEGYFPWQDKLEQRLQNCQAHGVLQGAQVRVERFQTVDDDELADVLDEHHIKHSA